MPGPKTDLRLKALPWTLLIEVALILQSRWRMLSDRDRERLFALVRESRGRVDRLSSRERAELRKIVGKLDIKGAGKELRPVLRMVRRGRR